MAHKQVNRHSERSPRLPYCASDSDVKRRSHRAVAVADSRKATDNGAQLTDRLEDFNWYNQEEIGEGPVLAEHLWMYRKERTLVKNDNRSRQTPHPPQRDLIRIVPLHNPEAQASAPTAAPKLTYRNGPLITSVEVFTIFWGSGWQQDPASGILTMMNEFFDFILSSSLMDQLSEYNVPGQSIGHGTRTGTITLVTPEPAASLTDQAIQKFLQREISTNGALPRPSPNTLYFIFVPAGTTVEQGGSKSCQQFCGYHDAIGTEIFYAVMPFPSCPGCLGGVSELDALTSTSSHELCEAITDPIPGEGWYDDANGEIGDICAWNSKKLGKFSVQLEWSNRANKCVQPD